jgi:hypothetical protein
LSWWDLTIPKFPRNLKLCKNELSPPKAFQLVRKEEVATAPGKMTKNNCLMQGATVRGPWLLAV